MFQNGFSEQTCAPVGNTNATRIPGHLSFTALKANLSPNITKQYMLRGNENTIIIFQSLIACRCNS